MSASLAKHKTSQKLVTNQNDPKCLTSFTIRHLFEINLKMLQSTFLPTQNLPCRPPPKKSTVPVVSPLNSLTFLSFPKLLQGDA